MEINSVTLEQALRTPGDLLADRELFYEVVAIGGGSLLLLGLIERTTKDLDLVAIVMNEEFISANPLPLNLLQASEDVGRALELGAGWLNMGPTSLLDLGLPVGFKKRMQTRQYGGLIIHLAGRFDQICFKLYAAVDQEPDSKHFSDLIILQPKYEEIKEAMRWCATHDVSEAFAVDLEAAVGLLGIGNANS